MPAGVVNIVPTDDAPGVVDAWLGDSRVRKISFTGSTRVGRELMRRAADRVVNSSMELGGNAPFVVTGGADVDAAVEGAMIAKFRGGGQACTAANRFYVHRSVLHHFTARFGARVEALTVGPANEGNAIGPLISARAVAGVQALIDDAVGSGASVRHAASVPNGHRGHFLAPTVLVDVAPDARVVQEEIFGPVAPIVAWDHDDELVEMVNASEFGLAGYVFAQDLGAALHWAERMDVGMVGVNRGVVSDASAPFGGTKQSGLGREGARIGLEEYLEPQYLSVAW